jgi:hypothetical protein
MMPAAARAAFRGYATADQSDRHFHALGPVRVFFSKNINDSCLTRVWGTPFMTSGNDQ